MYVSIELIKFINKAIALGYDVDVLFYRLLVTANGDSDYIKTTAVNEGLLSAFEADKLYNYLLEDVLNDTLFELRNLFHEAEQGRKEWL